MCQFTEIIHTSCEHKALSTLPEHTLLCNAAIFSELFQGVDTAPAFCIPVTGMQLTLAAHNVHFGFCEKCRLEAHVEQGKPMERGTTEDMIQIHAHVDENAVGVYEEHELRSLQDLKEYINKKMADAEGVAYKLEAFLAEHPDALTYITDPKLREAFSQGGMQKYVWAFDDELQQCQNLCEVLDVFVRERVDNLAFNAMYKYLHDKAKWAAERSHNFLVVADYLLNYEAGKPENVVENYKVRLSCFLNVVVRAAQRTGPYTASVEYRFYDETFELPDATRAQFEANEAVIQARLDQPPVLSQQTNPRRATGTSERNGLNKNGLTVIKEGIGRLLDGEGAKEIAGVIHNAFPEPNSVMCSTAPLQPLHMEKRTQPGQGLDVEDEFGNRLVWDANGDSVLICAPERVVAVGDELAFVALPTEVADMPKKVAKQTEGYGFEYPSDDEEDDNEATEGTENGDRDADDANKTSSPAETADAIDQDEPAVTPTQPSPTQSGEARSSSTQTSPLPLYNPAKSSSPTLSIAAGPHSPSTLPSPTSPRPAPWKQDTSPTPSTSSSPSPSRKRKARPNTTYSDSNNSTSDEEGNETSPRSKRRTSESPRGRMGRRSLAPSPESIASVATPAVTDVAEVEAESMKTAPRRSTRQRKKTSK